MSYLCLRATEFPAQARLALCPHLRSQPVAVLEHEPPLERVCSVNTSARQRGVHPGMTRVELDSIPGITTLRRSLTEEHSLRQALLSLLGEVTPRIEEQSSDYVCGFVLDLAGTERLAGFPLHVAERLQGQARVLGVETAFCGSGDVPSALVMVRTLRMGSRPVMLPTGQEAALLAPLPLSAIEPNAEQAETLARWGIRTLGQLAALPAAEVVSRMGQSGKRLHALASGTHAHHFRPIEPVFALEADATFEDAIELADSLLFVLGPLLDRLIALAATKAMALLSLSITLKLEKSPDHTLRLRPALPSTDRKFLLKLLQLELAAHPPAAAIVALQLTAEPAQPSREQGGLFSPQLPDSSRLDVTLARIQSIVGEGNVGSPQLLDTHTPEGFRMQPFRVARVAPSLADEHRPTHTACRRLRPPWTARVAESNAVPSFVVCEHQRFRVTRAYGPWRTSGAWWDTSRWARAEWEVVLQAENAPVPLHALLVQDLVAGAWRLEGMYD